MLRQASYDQSLVAVEDDLWDAFLVDDDERDPLPEPGDFWPDDDAEELTFTDTDHAAPLSAPVRREVRCYH